MSDTTLQVKIWRGTGATDSGRFVDYTVPRQENQTVLDVVTHVQRVLDHGQYIMGPEVAELEAALAAFTSRPALALPLLRAVEAGRFDRQFLTALHARQLRRLNDPQVNAALDRVWGRASESSADAKATIARIRDVYRNAPVWSYELEAGRKVYERACSACHAMGGNAGGKLGPDLGGTWRNGLDYFLENIVDPNAVVGAAYEMHVLTKRDGTVLSGMIDRETETAVVIRGVTETVTVAKSEIRERQKTTQSLMPAGLLEALPERETVELLKFLTTEPR